MEIGLGSVDLSLPQYRILGLLDEHSAVSSVLAERLAVRPPTITAVVDGLVARGLVERRPVEGDRRRVGHVLTPEGLALLHQADAAIEDRLHVVTDAMDDPAAAEEAFSGLARLAPRPRRLQRGPVGTMKVPTLRPRPKGPAETGTDFVPIDELARNEAPPAGIDPDRSLSWLRRALPIMRAHKGIFITSLTLSFVGLILQVAIPLLLNKAITNSHPEAHRCRSATTSGGSSASGCSAASSGYIARLFLFETAYDIEYDLRNIIYEHLTKMSFALLRPGPVGPAHLPGQLRHPLGADVHDLRPADPRPVLDGRHRVLRDADHQRPARPRRHGHHAVRLLDRRAHAEVDVPGVVDHPGPAGRRGHHRRRERERRPGGQVLRRRAAAAAGAVGAADKLQWGYIKDADLRARFTPMVQNLPQVGLALVLLFGGYMVIHGSLSVGAILTFNLYLLMLQAPFMMLGMLIMMGQRAAASAERIYEILDEQPTVTDAPDAIDLVDCTGDVRFRHVDFAYDRGRRAAGPGRLRPARPPGPDGGHRGTHRVPGSRPWRACSPASTTCGTARSRSTATTSGTSPWPACGPTSGSSSTSPSCSSVSVRDNIAYGRPSATLDEVEAAARAAGAHEFISHLADGYDTVVGERGYTLSGGQRQRIAIARTLLVNPPIMVLDDATSAIDVQVEQTIHAGLRVQMEGRTTIIIAHRLSTISLADRVVLLDSHRVVADGTHAELLATTPLYAEVLAQAAEFEAEEAREDGDGAVGRLRRARRTRRHARSRARRRCPMTWGGGFGGGGGGGFGGGRAGWGPRPPPAFPSPASRRSCRTASTGWWRPSPSTRCPRSPSSRTPTRAS